MASLLDNHVPRAVRFGCTREIISKAQIMMWELGKL
jgi:hypothetical protein